MARTIRPDALLIGVFALAAVAACGSGVSPAAVSLANGMSVRETVATPSPPSATSPNSPPPVHSSSPAAAAHDCLSGTLRVLYPGSDNPLRTSRVCTGTDIVVALTGKGSYRWAPVTSSMPAVVAATGSHAEPGGVTETTLRALHAGTATLTSADSFTPDAHGPPPHGWKLIIHVGP
ncbi:hypothetical protein ACFXKR_33335 [Streptomyces violascens]|uniref:hypothetical protein n=1 Tax=Streptomyces violascens TaxID=67381 RepID=UPI00369F0CBC